MVDADKQLVVAETPAVVDSVHAQRLDDASFLVNVVIVDAVSGECDTLTSSYATYHEVLDFFATIEEPA